MRDVSNFFAFFIDLLSTGVSFCFSLLSRISVFGVSLLVILISLILIGSIIPLVLSVVRRSSGGRTRTVSKKNKNDS